MRAFLVLLASVLIASAVPALATSDVPAQAPQAAIDAARESVAAGNLNGAIAQLQAYVAANPREADPERLLGDLYYRTGDLKKAEATYKAILLYAPLDKETHARLGSVYATENRVDDAIDEFNRSLPGTDSVPDLVALHLRKGDFAEYKHERELMVQEYPGDDDYILELGQLYEDTGMPVKASELFQKVLDTEPHSLFALNGMGLADRDQGDDTDAVTEFQLCLLYDGYDYSCSANLASAFYEMQQYGNAQKMAAVALHLAPERPDAYNTLGNLEDEAGDWKRAVADYVQAITVDPYAPEAYVNLGITYNEHGLYQLAESALDKGLAVAPMDGRLHLVLGDTYQRMGNNTLARAQYQLAAGPEDFYPYYRDFAKRRIATLAPETTP